MTDLSIEEIAPQDFELVWPMFSEAIQDGDSYPYPPKCSLEEGRAFWFSPGARVYLARLNGEPCATRYIVPNKPGLGSHVANTGVIISKAYRGRGLGRKMMEFALQEAKNIGFQALQLNLVVETNKASLKICEEYGFEIVGRLPGAFLYKGERLVDAFILYRTL